MLLLPFDKIFTKFLWEIIINAGRKLHRYLSSQNNCTLCLFFILFIYIFLKIYLFLIIVNKLYTIINQLYVVVSNIYIIINKLFTKKKSNFVNSFNSGYEVKWKSKSRVFLYKALNVVLLTLHFSKCHFYFHFFRKNNEIYIFFLHYISYISILVLILSKYIFIHVYTFLY